MTQIELGDKVRIKGFDDRVYEVTARTYDREDNVMFELSDENGDCLDDFYYPEGLIAEKDFDMPRNRKYMFRLFEPNSIEKEEYVIYGRTLDEVQAEIQQALKQGKNFLVASFED